MKFKFIHKISVIQEKFRVLFNLLRGPDTSPSGAGSGSRAAGCASLVYSLFLQQKCSFDIAIGRSFFSGSLPSRQVQLSDVATPLVVGLLLSAFYILPPPSNPTSFVLVFFLIFSLTFSLRSPFLTVILL